MAVLSRKGSTEVTETAKGDTEQHKPNKGPVGLGKIAHHLLDCTHFCLIQEIKKKAYGSLDLIL